MLKKLFLLASLAALTCAAAVPRPAGSVPFEVPGKGKDDIANYKGKVVIFAAFITTCPHCQFTTQVLSGIQRDFKSRGVQVIQVVFNDTDTPDVLREFVAKYQPPHPVGIVDGAYFVKWSGVTPEMRPTVPMVYIIDRQGVIQAEYMGASPMMEEKYQNENLRAKLMQYLSAAPGAGTPKAAPAKAKPAKK